MQVSFGFIPSVSTGGIFFYVVEWRLYFVRACYYLLFDPTKKIHRRNSQVGHLKFTLC